MGALNVKRRTLSSRKTFVNKFIIPVICVLTLPFYASAFIDDFKSDRSEGWFLLVIWLVVFLFICLAAVPLKKVAFDDEYLYVSNFIKETFVPLADIGKVTDSMWLRHHLVTIHFNSPSEFGTRIKFKPQLRRFGWYSSNPIISELEDLIQARQQEAIVAKYRAMKS